MTASPHDREPRKVPVQVTFNQRTLETASLPPGDWFNLRWLKDAKRERLFFASLSGRFTPGGRKVPSLYLSPSLRTSFRELYGDRIAMAEAEDATPIIEAKDLSERTFIEIKSPELLLVDLTTGYGLEAVGIDVGTANHPVIDHPRAWAQAIFDHPINADGIHYESRHTKEHCVVVWQRISTHSHDLSNPLSLGSQGTLSLDGHIELFGTKLLVAS